MIKYLSILVLVLNSIHVFTQSPIANFSATPLIVCVGENVNFTNTSIAGSSPIIQWDWDFGDGNSAITTNAVHSYTTAGMYTVILVVTDQNNLADPEVKAAYITVNPNPIALYTASANSCSLPVTGSFTNQSSTGSNFSYLWNFGNGQTSTSETPNSIVYNTVNSYNVSITVTNTTTGCHSSFSNSIVISDFTADFIIPDSVCLGNTVSMDDNSSVGVNGWDWNNGNGQTSTQQNPSFTYNTAGTYTVTLTSQNTTVNCTSTITHQIVVVPLPNITFTADETHGCTPFNISFSSPTPGNNFQWDFGDGSTYSGPNPSHTFIYSYASPVYQDTFSVTMSCTGILGCSNTATLTDYIYVDKLNAHFDSFQHSGCSPISVDYLDQSFHYFSNYDPVNSWIWTFDDGTTFNGQNPPDNVYTSGLYDLTLTVTTANGCTDTKSIPNYIQVGEIDSINYTYAPLIQCAKTPFNFTGITYIPVPFDSVEVYYSWYFGDGNESHTQNTSNGYAIDTGFFNVTFSIDFRGCLKTITKDSATYIKAPIARFMPSPFLVCNPTSFPVPSYMSDMSIIGKTTDDVEMIWNWNSPVDSTTTFEDSDLDPDDDGGIGNLYPDYGTYLVEQVIHNYTTGCSDNTTYIIEISQLNANFSQTADTICIGEEVTFNTTSTSLDPITYNQFLSYPFFIDSNHSISSLTYLFDTAGVFFINHTSRNNVECVNSITKPLVVLALPIASFSSSDDASCAPATITFTNTTAPSLYGYPTFSSFNWTFPDNSTQTTTDIADSTNYTFTTQGNFTTSMFVTDDFGCISSPVSLPTSITLPVPNFTVDDVVCDEEIFDAINSSIGYDTINYQWKIDNIDTDTATNLNYFFNEITDTTITNTSHIITLYVTDGNGCIDSLSKTITVSLPFANLDYTATSANLNNNNSASCPPVFETFDNQSTSFGTFNSSWIFGDGKTSTLTVPANTYVFAGTYTLNMSITDQYGCVDDTTFFEYLKIGGPIINYSIIPTVDICDNQFIFDTLFTDNVVDYTWNFGDGIIDTNSTISHNYPHEGTYFTSITIHDSVGCEVIYPLDTITVNNQLDAFFVPNTINGQTNTDFIFDDQSVFNVTGVSWLWEFGDFNNSSQLNNSGANTSFSYPDPFYYTVKLTVTDSNGCIDDYQIIIHASGQVNVPNVFTPNGDGKNDNFKFPYDIFKSYDVLILNRWGEVVYEKENNSETYIWNGTKMEGEQCSEGVYFYKIKGILIDESPFDVTGFLTKF